MLKRLAKAYVQFVQKVALNILLTLLNVFGFGPSAVVARLLRMRIVRGSAGRATHWLPAEEYDPDLEACREQS